MFVHVCVYVNVCLSVFLCVSECVYVCVHMCVDWYICVCFMYVHALLCIFFAFVFLSQANSEVIFAQLCIFIYINHTFIIMA